MRMIRKTDEPKKIKYSIFVYANNHGEYKEENFYCPTCGAKIKPQDMYINECEVCQQKLDWRKL